MGSNMAEQHPVGFQWVVEAKERGAQVFHVDPRYTRTSAIADVHVPLRAGTDVAWSLRSSASSPGTRSAWGGPRNRRAPSA